MENAKNNNDERRRVITQQYKIPQEYQEVQYIESTGSQYINTSIKPTSIYIGLEMKLNFKCSNMVGIAGFNKGDDEAGAFTFRPNNNSAGACFWFMGYYYGKYGQVQPYLPLETDTVCKMDENGIIIDNVSYSYTHTPTFYDTGLTIYLFYCDPNGKNWNYPDYMKLYWAKIVSNSQLVRNFIPCYRISDNVAGMYDLVTNQFFTNQGTGTFITGPEVYY